MQHTTEIKLLFYQNLQLHVEASQYKLITSAQMLPYLQLLNLLYYSTPGPAPQDSNVCMVLPWFITQHKKEHLTNAVTSPVTHIMHSLCPRHGQNMTNFPQNTSMSEHNATNNSRNEQLILGLFYSTLQVYKFIMCWMVTQHMMNL